IYCALGESNSKSIEIRGRTSRSRLLLQERIRPAFLPDRCRGTVAWIHTGVIAEGEQRRSDRTDQRRIITARQIRATDRSRKERIADEQILPGLAASPNL